ncbi:hypothetical protein ACFL59_13360 [Planctomycetota bacterium]
MAQQIKDRSALPEDGRKVVQTVTASAVRGGKGSAASTEEGRSDVLAFRAANPSGVTVAMSRDVSRTIGLVMSTNDKYPLAESPQRMRCPPAGGVVGS